MFQHQTLTNIIVKKVYDRVEEIPHQRKGSSADYIIDGSFCLEVKLDFMAEKTGNIFVEYATKFNDVLTDSGITLAAKWNYTILYVVIKADRAICYSIPAEQLLQISKENGKSTQTRPKVNSNRPGFFGMGYKLPLTFLHNFLKQEVIL